MNNVNKGTRYVAFMGIMLAVLLIASYIESLFPSPGAGIKLGLSNVFLMFAVITLGFWEGITLCFLKSVFIGLVRGVIAGALSLTGGLISVLVMALLLLLTKKKISFIMLSISGAISHNLAQFALAVFILRLPYFSLFYIPILIFAGVGFGFITGFLLKLLHPYLTKILTNFKN